MLEAAFTNLGWEFNKAEGYYMLSCPLAKWLHDSGTDHNPSMIVRPGQNYFHCFSCGRSGEVYELFQQFNDISGSNINYEDFELWVEWKEEVAETENIVLDKSILKVFEPFNQKAFDYLEKRGIDFDSVDRYNLLWDKRNNNIVFPVYEGEKLIGASGRNVGKFTKQKHYHYMGMLTTRAMASGQYNEHEKNLIVEGFTDILNCWKWANDLGYDPYGTFTSSLSEWQANKLLQTDSINHIAWDQDNAGKKARKKLGLLDEDFGLTVHNWKPTDLDVGGMNKEQFYKLFK